MANNNNNKVLNVPNLRFPEFTGEWKGTKVSDLLDFFSTNSLSWEQLDYEGGEIRNLHYGLIHKGLPTLVDIHKNILPFIKDSNTPRNYMLCQNGDITFADASEDTNDVAKAVEFKNCQDSKVVCGLHTIHGRDKSNNTVIGFKGYAFSSFAFHKQIRRIAQGTKIYSINTRNFDETFIGIPSKGEQFKIASLLSLLDERIAVQTKIINKLQSLIKGLNNDFHNNIDGIATSFSYFGETYSGLSGKNAASFGSGKPYITYLNVYQNDHIDNSKYDYVAISDGEKQGKVAYGDVLFTLSSETANEVGIGSVYLGKDEELYLNSFCFGIHIKDCDIIYPPYMAYFVSSQYFRKAIYPLAQGSTRFNLQKSDFMKKKFVLPSLKRQKQVACVLNSLSEKISTEKQQLSLLETGKRYLLQQMFI